jgi:hypothetical protein
MRWVTLQPMANQRARAGLVASLAIVLSAPVLAQPIHPATIADKELGWIKVYHFPPATEPLKVDTRVYSTSQRNIAVDLANWMQASYNPIGGLGDVVRTFPRLSGAEPQSYGVVGKIYDSLKYGANGKIELYTGDSYSWNVMVNGAFGRSAEAINTPERYYLTLPDPVQHGFTEEIAKAVDLSGHPFLGRFPAYLATFGTNGTRKFVLLSKDGRLPFVKLTRGEYLDALGIAITRAYELDKKKLAEAEQGDQQRIARGITPIEERTAKRRAVLETNRAKYNSRLQEVAEISTVVPDIALESVADVFEGNGSSRMRLPVYTVDAATLERCKSGTPQWIVVSWSAELKNPVSKHLYDAVVNQFNMEYIYNRFFDPEKVKGLAYTPRPARAETVAADASAASKTLAADPGVYFFEDFSRTPIGKPALDWKSTLTNTGASSLVVERNGLDGHWASVSGFMVSPRQLKSPLPRDFTVSFDLVAARDYTWGARGMTFRLSKGIANSGTDAIFSVRLRPGFDGKDGETVIEGKFPGAAADFTQTRWVAAPGFSNNQPNNRITVRIRKQGEMVQVFIGQTKVAEYARAIPEALLFDAVSFDLQQQPGPNDQMFISNVKIVREQ